MNLTQIIQNNYFKPKTGSPITQEFWHTMDWREKMWSRDQTEIAKT